MTNPKHTGKQTVYRSTDRHHEIIEIVDCGDERLLMIDAIEQSRIDKTRADRLCSPVHQHLLAPLLFVDSPQRLLLGGLGGGALARYIHDRQPAVEGTVLEINDSIAELARSYFHFPRQRWQIVIEDLRRWQGDSQDMILVDIADHDLTPSWLSQKQSIIRLQKLLSADGVLAINLLLRDAQSLSDMLSVLRSQFEKRTLCLTVPDHRNIIVMAFNQQPRYHAIDDLKKRTGILTRSWGIDFSAILDQLQCDNPANSGVI